MSEVTNSRDDAAFLEPPVSFEFEATEQQAQKRRKLFAMASPDHKSAAMELVETTWEKQACISDAYQQTHENTSYREKSAEKDPSQREVTCLAG